MSAGGIKAGKAFVELAVSGKKKVFAALKAVGRRIKSFGSGMARITSQLARMGGAVILGGAAIAATGLAVALTKSVSAASDLQETMNKFNVVFGESAGEIKAWSDKTAAAFGRSKKQIADFMASAQDLLEPMGLDTASATEMSKNLTRLAMDVASFNNKSDDEVMVNFRAALTGSGEVMKEYGVIVSEATVKQELMRQGLNPKEATEAQKAMARYNLIVEGTSKAHGDVARSSESFANQMKTVQAKVDDLFASIGTALLPVLESWLSDLIALMGVMSDTDGIDGQSSAIEDFAEVLKTATSPIILFAKAWSAVAGAFRTAQSQVTKLSQGIIWLTKSVLDLGIGDVVFGKDGAKNLHETFQAMEEDLGKLARQQWTQAGENLDNAFGDALDKRISKQKKKIEKAKKDAAGPIDKIKIGGSEGPPKKDEEVIKQITVSLESLSANSIASYKKFRENKQNQLQSEVKKQTLQLAKIENNTRNQIVGV